MTEENLISTRFCRFSRTSPLASSDVIQRVSPFVKPNVAAKMTSLVGGTVFIVFMFLALVAPQGLCLTAEEIAYLKKAGVTDETIQRMIDQENEERPYSKTGIYDVEDEEGNRSAIYHVGDEDETAERKRAEQEKVDRAWEMLRTMIIDARRNE